MCGICGVLGFRRSEQVEPSVRAMLAKMVHRGPDDEGLFVDRSVALGMRRLSIIDLSGGQQPLFNEEGTLAVIFNGEIYNFQDLRRTLESRGHVFQTCSDTEVIIHGYEEWGMDCVEHLQGMFAFAVTETSKAARQEGVRVLLARDRLGIKPLYYALAGETLFFASEVRALLATGQLPRRLSVSALRSYLLFGSVAEPMTLVDGILSLPPGHRMSITVKSGVARVQSEPYWDFGRSVRPDSAGAILGHDSAPAFLRSLLDETMARYMIADVPLGIFLSSGIDSTTLVALGAQVRHPGKAGAGLDTLTVVFSEREFSEAALARQTAERFGTRHSEILLSGEQMLARLAEAVAALDQPSMDGINSYFVSWAARQAGLKVALSGLGGDEIFGGYTTFRWSPHAQSLAALARRVPARMRWAAAGAAEAVSGLLGRGDGRRKVLALFREPDSLPHPYFYTRLLFTPGQASELLPELQDGAPSAPWYAWLSETARQAEELDDFAAVSCLEARSYMASTLLRDTDSMSMANSLEVRVPFLDHRVVEFVGRLPESHKRVNGRPKSLLIRALGDLMPREVAAQPKRTFTLPWQHWLRNTLRERVEAGLEDFAPPLAQVLSRRAVRQVWKNFVDGRTGWARVWSLFVLNEWAKQHLTE
jgi:asparagine synthase (glutamine-hydrolysing)